MTFIFHSCFLLEVEDTPRGRGVPPGLRLDCVSSGCGRVPGGGVSPAWGRDLLDMCSLCGRVLCGGGSSVWGRAPVWACPWCGRVLGLGACPLGHVLSVGACPQCGRVPDVGACPLGHVPLGVSTHAHAGLIQ